MNQAFHTALYRTVLQCTSAHTLLLLLLVALLAIDVCIISSLGSLLLLVQLRRDLSEERVRIPDVIRLMNLSGWGHISQ